MIQNILFMLIGAAFGMLVLGVIEANIRIMYIRKISALKISNSKILSKNQKLFEEMQDLEIQIDRLHEFIITNLADEYIDYFEDC